MSINSAKCNYLGQNGSERMNCAESVIKAFKERFLLEDRVIELFKTYGRGCAPDGMCGAFYAAKYIIENCEKEKAEDLERYIIQQAGALDCRSIRGMKKLSCVGCVEKSAEYLENVSGDGSLTRKGV